ncbi:glutamate-5-semialdehyde dehydrogenase [Clostridium polynesiense]|uniref:glutamate-5-semialdehyde dehydrogenase n=1 Tax=Clostridium polynesiense TaxID=1325933 RepID=UPI000590F909|nr:glutamate-5-semialdehyde dehydrogenase [Clostridium polynesiense]
MNELMDKAVKAKNASKKLSLLSNEQKNNALSAISQGLKESINDILYSNKIDIEMGRASGLSEAMIDRLALTKQRILDIASAVEQIADLTDPVGEVIESFERPNGLIIEKVRVPLGVIGIIYEARPNVTVDCCALAIKTGNAVILRGSSSALNSNKALIKVIKSALRNTDIPEDSVQLIEAEDKAVVTSMLKLNKYLDVIIPRGGVSLIRHAIENSTVPVIETGVGNCHIYIDEEASLPMAVDIAVNAKTHRPSVCNAAETLLVQKDWAEKHLSKLADALTKSGVELRGCPQSLALYPSMKKAQEEDWEREYLDLIMAVKIVKDVHEAISHIDKYGSRHTEAIITEDKENAELFMQIVDAAAVNHNASTRFTDGFQYGFGAEIGISTQKLHARGPMGLKELTSYKYLVHGNGQIRN